MNGSARASRPDIGPGPSAGPTDASTKGVSLGGTPPHRRFLGLQFCLLDLAQTVRLILEYRDPAFAYVVTPNVPHIVKVHEEPDRLLPIYHGAWLSLCDSQVVRRLAALKGISLPLVAGSDLVAALLAEQDSPRPYGGRKRLLVVGPDRAIETTLHLLYPRVDIKVLPAPSGLAQEPNLRLQVARACLARRWDIMLLCVGNPVQEMIAAEVARQGCPSGVALCVGASIDFATGSKTRAPRLMRALGLEWAYRLSQEPRRLWRRYLVDAPKILRIFAGSFRAPDR